MGESTSITRRAALGAIAGGAGVAALAASKTATAEASPPLKGRLKQSACRWCYSKMDLDDLCRNAAEIGLKSIELLDVAELEVPERYGLTCAMVNGPSGITRGWNRTEDHDQLVASSKKLLEQIGDRGMPNMIVFSGNVQRGQSSEEGMDACARGLTKIMKTAEKHDVTVCMELLNSKVDHRGYQCDHTAWGVQLVEKVGHDRFKLLYDIYHMQIMEGDVIRTITDNKDYIRHYHTGGVPGRNEIDDTQELNYRTICQAIVEMGFSGYLAQEFIPKRDPMTSLAEAARICDV